jgi:two-component system, NtrC family, nitrogen regulation response regulator GlnG
MFDQSGNSIALPVLLVDNEPQSLQDATVALNTSGFPDVLTLNDGRQVFSLLAEREVGVIVFDLGVPQIPGQTILEQVGADYPDTPVVVTSTAGDLEVAVQCMQAGAVDYLVKPVEWSRLAASVKRALQMCSWRAGFRSFRERFLRGTLHEREAFAEIVTHDRAMLANFRYIEAIAPSPLPVLITGETGTGKELIAKAIHRLSKRCGEIVAVNAAGLDDTLFSDALFGHSTGAFTGADRTRDGLIRTAGEGTLFLDEIGDLSIASQVKLLRLLQDGTYYRLGADRSQKSNARIIVATNCDLAELVAAGRFRKDLYFRLRTHQLHLPPLRQRRGDISLLITFFAGEAARVLGKPVPAIPRAIYDLLQAHDFPGNIRELQAMVFDAVARYEGIVLSSQSFRESICSKPAVTSVNLFPERLLPLRQAEEALTEEALARAGGNQAVAATLLGISRQALNKRLSRRRHSASISDTIR